MQTPAQARKLISRRIHEKTESFASEEMSRAQKTALDIFLDLSLEYESVRDFKSLCVLIPEELLGVSTSLYLRDKRGRLQLRRTTNSHSPKLITFSEPVCPTSAAPLKLDDFVAFPMCTDTEPPAQVIGVYCVHKDLNEQETDFFSQYVYKANKILSIKQTVLQNRQHLAFVNNLVRDIGHNVIVPNMHFKLLFLRMEKLLAQIKISAQEAAHSKEGRNNPQCLGTALMLDDLETQLASITKRFQQASLFLESLLRRSHFEKGHYDLILKPCKFKSQIIEPQIDRFRSLFMEQAITVNVAPEVHIDDDITLDADLGLISQVFANLLSNAVKYTQAVSRANATPLKEVLYGWERLPDAFGQERPGVRLFVSTTGALVPPKEAARLFEADFRSEASLDTEGTGHGLYFVKQIVELHGGKVGYAHSDAHNIFHLTLPCSPFQEKEIVCLRQS